MHPILSDYGVTNDLLIYDGDAHVPWDTNASDREEMIDFVTSFVYANINCNQTSIQEGFKSKELVFQFDFLGRTYNPHQKGFVFNIYKDGSVDKEYILD